MYVEVYRVTEADQVPELLFAVADWLDDRYVASFYNYPDSEKIVVCGWGTTGEADGQPMAVLVATAGHIITGYVDLDEGYDHSEPSPKQRRIALLRRLVKESQTSWLLVHDADEVAGWTEVGFRRVKSPVEVRPKDAVRVLTWGELPESVNALLYARSLSWNRNTHRYPSQTNT